jgi:hypothetical protein
VVSGLLHRLIILLIAVCLFSVLHSLIRPAVVVLYWRLLVFLFFIIAILLIVLSLGIGHWTGDQLQGVWAQRELVRRDHLGRLGCQKLGYVLLLLIDGLGGIEGSVWGRVWDCLVGA